MAISYKGQRKESPKAPVQILGIPLAGFAGNVVTEQVAQGLPLRHHQRKSLHVLWHGQDASVADAVGWALWLSPLLPLPAGADPFSRVARPRCSHHTLPTSVPKAHGDARHIPHRRMLGHQRVHMDACPPGWRSRRRGLSA